jgi:hypothetical protein
MEAEKKDSYDEALRFSKITAENWLMPDQKYYALLGAGEEDWIKPFLRPQLEATVPLDVIRAFEIARGCLIYSWFFYPLATVSLEQCTRVCEFAARERCRLLQQKSERFADSLDTLIAAGLISGDDAARWQEIRRLQNDRSHLEGLILSDLGEAFKILSTTAELINLLFANPAAAG